MGQDSEIEGQAPQTALAPQRFEDGIVARARQEFLLNALVLRNEAEGAAAA